MKFEWSLGKYIAISFTILYVLGSSWILYSNSQDIETNQENNILLARYALLQSDKLSALENKCSESAKQIAQMCDICNSVTEPTEELIILEEE